MSIPAPSQITRKPPILALRDLKKGDPLPHIPGDYIPTDEEVSVLNREILDGLRVRGIVMSVKALMCKHSLKLTEDKIEVCPESYFGSVQHYQDLGQFVSEHYQDLAKFLSELRED